MKCCWSSSDGLTFNTLWFYIYIYLHTLHQLCDHGGSGQWVIEDAHSWYINFVWLIIKIWIWSDKRKQICWLSTTVAAPLDSYTAGFYQCKASEHHKNGDYQDWITPSVVIDQYTSDYYWRCQRCQRWMNIIHCPGTRIQRQRLQPAASSSFSQQQPAAASANSSFS